MILFQFSLTSVKKRREEISKEEKKRKIEAVPVVYSANNVNFYGEVLFFLFCWRVCVKEKI